MAGIYGNSFYDRAMEARLDAYLDSLDKCGCDCGYAFDVDDNLKEGVDDVAICPECQTEINLF